MNTSYRIAACVLGLLLGGCGSPAGGKITFTASGEKLALGGYDFPPGPDGAEFVDGWAVKFDHFIVTIDKIMVSESPDLVPGDQSKTGALVAEVDGPWAVDLTLGGPLPGKGGGGEQAKEIATLDNQNQNGNAAFALDTRYAFGFDLVAASDAAQDVNLDADGKAIYEEMKQKGYVVLYDGTATFKGTDCAPGDTAGDFAAMPAEVHFHLGSKSPTSYLNCQNPDNDPAKPLGDEEHERGFALKSNTTTFAQVTVHSDHPFWESFVHDSPAHFDMLAAQHVGETTPTVVLEDVKGVDPTAITDGEGNPVLWRTCDAKNYTPPHQGQMNFNPLDISINPQGDPATSIRDLYDYMTYNQSTQGHLNSDGLCYVARHYPSPP